jgi:hypothetical protein
VLHAQSLFRLVPRARYPGGPSQTAMSKRKKRKSAAPDAPSSTPGEPAEPAPPPAEHEAAPAAIPSGELGFSESTAHWLAQGEGTGPTALGDEYGPAARAEWKASWTASNRRRDMMIIGGATLLAAWFAWILHGRASRHEPPPPQPASPAALRATSGT